MAKTREQTKAGWIRHNFPAEFQGGNGLDLTALPLYEIQRLHEAIFKYGARRARMEREDLATFGPAVYSAIGLAKV